MMNVRDFTESERQLAARTLHERYGHPVEIEVAEAEIQLDPEGDDLELCPVMYWEERGAHFVVFKMGEGRFTAQFFYNEAQQYGTGKQTFDSLGDCVVTVLQVQSDHERMMKGMRSGMTALDVQDDYDGPLIV